VVAIGEKGNTREIGDLVVSVGYIQTCCASYVYVDEADRGRQRYGFLYMVI